MAVIPVALAGREYEVRIGSGLLTNCAEEAAAFLRKDIVPVVTDSNVALHWRSAVEASLAKAGKTAVWHVVEPGEGAKSWSGLEALTDWMLAQGVERGDHVLALGG
ncbi:MAG: hypothetical protein ABJM62_08580, partial [Marinomonas sp.]